jgi:RNA polymerase sigma factor (sigma-70 family)
MKQTNERLCALAQKGDAAALDSLIDNNKSFIGKVANDLFRSMNLAQSGLNLDTDDLKQAGNMGLWKAVPKFDAARGMKFLTYAAPAIRNAMMDMVRDAFTAFEQRMVTVVTTVMLLRSGTEENLEKKRELWRYIKNKDIGLFHRLRRGIMGQTMNLPGRSGRKISVAAYRLSQKVVGFN